MPGLSYGLCEAAMNISKDELIKYESMKADIVAALASERITAGEAEMVKAALYQAVFEGNNDPRNDLDEIVDRVYQ